MAVKNHNILSLCVLAYSTCLTTKWLYLMARGRVMDNMYIKGQIDTLFAVSAQLNHLTSQIENARGRQEAVQIITAFAQTLIDKAEVLEKDNG